MYLRFLLVPHHQVNLMLPKMKAKSNATQPANKHSSTINLKRIKASVLDSIKMQSVHMICY